MKSGFDKWLMGGAVVLIALLMANAALMLDATGELRERSAKVAHSREVIATLESLSSLMINAESGQRGFLITGEPHYLDPFNAAVSSIDSRIDALEKLTADDSAQQGRLPIFREHVAQRLRILSEVIALRKNLGFEAAQKVVVGGEGKQTMDALHADIRKMLSREQKLLQDRTEKTAATFRAAVATALLANLAALGAVGAFIAMLRRQLAARAAATRALADQGERLRTTLASIGDAVITTDTEGRVTNLNAKAEILTGWTNSEAEGRALEEVFCIVDETTREKIENPVVRASREETPAGPPEHTVLIARDGTERGIDDNASPIRSKAGVIAGFVLVFRDITERRRAERALRTSEARNSAVLTSALDCIISMDHEGRIVDFNPAAEQTFGYEKAGVVGRTVADTIVPPEFREAHRRGLARFLSTGEGPVLGTRIQLTAQRADGSQFPCELAITSTRLADDPPFFTAYLRDITERVQHEAAVRARAEEMARAERSKDEFLAMLAHELRNPLAPLRNAAEILRSDTSSEDERAQAQRILGRQTENMSRMIDDLLDVSRITEGKIELRRQPVSLEATLTSAASLARLACATRGQQLTVTLPPEPVFLNADSTRLEQIFNNLLGNASKYSGEGCHIVLEAELAAGSEPPEVIVRVRDDGVGIDPELLPRIFDLFVQSSRTLDRAHGGLGIGLTLVDRLVDLHGGSVAVRSEGLGHGSEFTVRLPILREAPPAPLPPPPAPPETPRRILIVDDNTDAARSLAILQSRAGHQTRTAFTGPDALTAAAEFLPEIVLLDIGLPGMNGFEVARHLRTMAALDGVLIIAMSGYGRDEDREEARAAGFDHYLVKPLDLHALRERLRKRG